MILLSILASTETETEKNVLPILVDQGAGGGCAFIYVGFGNRGE